MSKSVNKHIAGVGDVPRARLLVVEDEILIRMFVSEVLRDAGYEVIEATNGDEAVRILTSGVPVDLIFSDVRMPGSTDGLGLLAFVRQNLAALPVIITSGHLSHRVALVEGAARFLAKPFNIEDALAAVKIELARTK